MRNHTKTRISNLAIAIAALALFVALGGPAYAAKAVKQISGKSIKARSITSKQLADGSVTLAKVAASAQTSLKAAKGATGPKGALGPIGPEGDKGARGRSGGYDVYDAKDRRIGTYAGMVSSFLLVANDEGAVFVYDHDPSTGSPLGVIAPTLHFKTPGCDGTGYETLSVYPANWATILSSTPGSGDTAYIPKPDVPPESFTAQSDLTPSGCVDATTAMTDVVPMIEAGTVPAVKKPLSLRAR